MSILTEPGSGGASLEQAPPLDFIEFLEVELALARDAAELLLGLQLRNYTSRAELGSSFALSAAE